MPTNTAGDVGRLYHSDQVHYFCENITFANAGTTVTLGTLPPGAVVVDAGVVVTTAFNGSSPTLDIGTSGDTDGFATLLSLGTIGRIVADEMATSNDLYATTATTISCTLSAMSGASAGVGFVYVEYLMPDR